MFIFFLLVVTITFGVPAEDAINIKDEAVDISHWQENVDFDRIVQSGVKIIIHKATQGIKYVDSEYEKNQKAAKVAGLGYWGTYHFAENTDGEQQAKHYLDVARNADFYAIDLEPYGNKTVCTKQAEDIVHTIIRETGRTPLIYGGANFLNTLNRSDILAKCPLWVASWRGGEPTLPSLWKDWAL